MKNILLLVVVILGILYFIGINTELPKGKDIDTLMAYGYAEKVVKNNLKSPSSAVFPETSDKLNHINEISYTNEDNSKWYIDSWVDSQNGFGAMLRSKFTCIIIVEDGKVRYEDLNIK